MRTMLEELEGFRYGQTISLGNGTSLEYRGRGDYVSKIGRRCSSRSPRYSCFMGELQLQHSDMTGATHECGGDYQGNDRHGHDYWLKFLLMKVKSTGQGRGELLFVIERTNVQATDR